jgi:ATP/maltotriose-dependent transcriptional regulator MalT/DNA-binding SARP family transcriptional activator
MKKLHTNNIAKITRPEVSGTLFRQRLFHLIQQAEKSPVIWVSGPPGAGKTSLLSSYITSRNAPCLWYKIDSGDTDLASFFKYMAQASKKSNGRTNELPVFNNNNGIDTAEFTRDFFAKIYSNTEERSYLVFDNYQEISEEILLHELLVDTFNLMPESVRVIIISRKEPFSKFSRLHANRRMDFIDWQDIRFTRDEFQDVVSQWGFGDIPKQILDSTYYKMDGWIAGLLFILEGTKKYHTNLQNVGIGAFEEIYQYFAGEAFEFQENDVKNFLLKTSVLPYLTTRLAQDITGVPRACKTLSCLNRNNLFIEKLCQSDNTAYRYHPLFREYLQEKMEEFFKSDEIIEIKRQAAKLLLGESTFEEAAELLLMAEDWEGFINIVIQYAPLLINQGRNQLLEKWLHCIPAENFSKNPWMSYWLGVCQQQFDPLKARDNFTSAFETACAQQDIPCSFASWSGLIDSIIRVWDDFIRLDHLIDWLDKHYPKENDNLCCEMKVRVAASMVYALMIRRPQSPEIVGWVEYLDAEALCTKDVELSMQAYLAAANYYLWWGDQSSTMILLEKIRIHSKSPRLSTISVLKTKYLEAQIYAWLTGDAQKCLQTVEHGLDIAKSTGVHIMNHSLFIMGAFGALLNRNYSLMTVYLQKVEKKLDNCYQHSFFCHHYFSAWLHISRGNVLAGIKHADKALQTATTTGHLLHKALGHFATAHVLFDKGDFQESAAQLTSFGKISEAANNSLFNYLYYLTKAQFSLDLGKEQVGTKYLKKAIQLGREQNYRKMMCWWNPKAITRLSMHALEKDIETEYVKDIINYHGLIPASAPIEIEEWPWPVKIYTLGRFEIVIDGKPVRFSGKAQQKPLAMLKALISLGGRNVSEFQLAEALWPDADGDMQHQSTATTLYRLRRFLGHKVMIEFQNGHLSLNPKYTWVDAWAFERLLTQSEIESVKNNIKSPFFAARYAETAIMLYKGSFLPQNNLDYWSIHLRERLKSRFLRGVIFLGSNLEKINEQNKAVLHYQKALEIDPLVEEFYQRLMICYHRKGRYAAAASVYKRCQKNLQSMMNVGPSTQTKAIYKNLITKSLNQHNPLNIKKEKKLEM